MDEVIHHDWEKKLERYNLSERQIEQPCGDCSLTQFSGIANLDELHPSGKYAALMFHRIMSAERLRVVSPERTAEIMKLCPPDDIGRPGKSAIDIKSSLSRELEPDGFKLQTWGRVGRTCSALRPSDEDWIWFKYALDDRWMPPMHEIISIARAGSDDREWQERQTNHSRGDRTGLGHSIDKIKRPSWARNPQTLAFALNSKFPGLKDGRKPPQNATHLFEAMDVIWKRKETSLSESQRASMRKELERFRQFGLGLGKDAQRLFAHLMEALCGNLNDSQGDPKKLGFVFLWVWMGFLTERDLEKFLRSRQRIEKKFSETSAQGIEICKKIETIKTANYGDPSFDLFDYLDQVTQLKTESEICAQRLEEQLEERKEAHNQLLYETLNKAAPKAFASRGKSVEALAVLNSISCLYNS